MRSASPRCGQACPGEAWSGLVRRGAARHGLSTASSIACGACGCESIEGHAEFLQGSGWARRGMVRHGMARADNSWLHLRKRVQPEGVTYGFACG